MKRRHPTGVRLERQAMQRALVWHGLLKQNGGNKAALAREVGVSRERVRQVLAKYPEPEIRTVLLLDALKSSLAASKPRRKGRC